MIQVIRIRHVFFACGFIEAGGEVAWKFRNEKTKGRFLRFARFRTPGEVSGFFEDVGFTGVSVARRARGFCVMSGRSNEAGELPLPPHPHPCLPPLVFT